jgi:hypothetical protein
MSIGTPKSSGAALIDFDAPPVVMAPERAADLVGRKVGEIAALPGDGIPSTWSPIWMIERGRSNRRVIFCGGDLDLCMPSNEAVPDRKRVKDWKHLLWNERMRLIGPFRDPLAALWRKFRETAENA